MNKTNIILIIILLLILIIVLSILSFKYYNEKINALLKKTKKSEKQLLDKLNIKYDILIELTQLVETKFKIKSKKFDEIKNIKINSIYSFETEKKLDKCYNEIIKIKEDNSKSKKLKNIKELIQKYDDNELHIISLRTYYNKYTMKYNNRIKKFPYFLIAKLKKYNLKLLLEGKEIEKD